MIAPNLLCFCLSHMMSLTIGNSSFGFDLFSSFAASQVLRRTTYFTRTGSTFRQQLGKKVVLTSKIDQRKREMAVKNARNFVRDVNTRKICYSFCHRLEYGFLVSPYYLIYGTMQYLRSRILKKIVILVHISKPRSIFLPYFYSHMLCP